MTTPNLGQMAHCPAFLRNVLGQGNRPRRKELSHEPAYRRQLHDACLSRAPKCVVDHHHWFPGGCYMSWTKPEFEVVELGMEVGAYAGNA